MINRFLALYEFNFVPLWTHLQCNHILYFNLITNSSSLCISTSIYSSLIKWYFPTSSFPNYFLFRQHKVTKRSQVCAKRENYFFKCIIIQMVNWLKGAIQNILLQNNRKISIKWSTQCPRLSISIEFDWICSFLN